MEKKVSIIIPCYNQSKYVSDAIESALNQTYLNTEVVIVNDGSTDNSSEIIKKYADRYKNILFFDNEENNGVVYARNLAVKACRGEYILPLDADDVIEKTYVEKAVKVLDNNSDVGIVYCESWNLTTNMQRFYPEYNKLEFMYQNMIFVCAMFRKSDFEKVGGYNYNMDKGYEDWDFWLSLIEIGKKPYRIPEKLFGVRNVENSRNDNAKEFYHFDLLETLINNHANYYLSNKEFVKNSFEYWRLKKRFDRRKRKFIATVSIISLILLLSFCLNLRFVFGG